jgi:glycosyltransferase involved in cell wall biosynthesis
MRLLWLTRDYPYPVDSGQTLYTQGLVNALAAVGAMVTAVTYPSRNASFEELANLTRHGVEWIIVPRPRVPMALSLLSGLPKDAYAASSAWYRAAVEKLLAERSWDAVVIDYVSMGWMLPVLRQWRAQRPQRRLVYVAHNHESTLRPGVARGFRGNPLMKVLLRHDAGKYARLEQALLREVDLVTAITPEDRALFVGAAPAKPVIALSPGFAGAAHADWRLDQSTPRKVVISGSFEWIAKQQNLLAFLRIADPLFAAAGITLEVVGVAPPDLVKQIKRWARCCEFTGLVEDVAPYLEGARLGVMAEQIGGGFKLKMLDYVFAGLPIAAIKGQLAGLPLVPGTDMIVADTVDELCARIVAAIDDVALLNRLRRNALSRCAGRFDWKDRARALLDAIARSGAWREPALDAGVAERPAVSVP